MKVVVTAGGMDLDAQVSPVFGRCPAFVFVDTETMVSEGIANPALAASGGAGIKAAQFVVEKSVEAVLTGNVGPNAYGVLGAASVPVYLVAQGSVRQAVAAYRAGSLPSLQQANAQAHAGLGGGQQRNMRGGGPGGQESA